MTTNHERITKALDLLTRGLFPYVEREMKSVYADRWLDAAAESFRKGRGANSAASEALKWDAHALLTVVWDQWNSVFRNKLGFRERSLVSELREFRNDWAHQRPFDFDDTYRVLDGIQRLLSVGEDDEGAVEVATMKREMLREQFAVQEDLGGRQEAFQRKRRSLLALYVVCCLLIVLTTFNAFGLQAWPVLVLVVTSFAYFGYNLVTHRPRLVPTREPSQLGGLLEEVPGEEPVAAS